MNFLSYILIGIGTATLFGLSPIFGIMIAILLFLRKHLHIQARFQQRHAFNTPSAYHYHLFSLMGYLAKADGLISSQEIKVAQDIMQSIGLNYAQKAMAKNAFKEGSKGLNLNNTISFLKILAHTQPSLVHTYLEHQNRIIHADSHKSMQQINILNQIKFHVFSQQTYQHQTTTPPPPSGGSIQDAYRILGINNQMDFDTMKRTYRKLIGKHHPDRQRTPAEKKIAEEKIKQYQKAWKSVQLQHQKATA